MDSEHVVGLGMENLFCNPEDFQSRETLQQLVKKAESGDEIQLINVYDIVERGGVFKKCTPEEISDSLKERIGVVATRLHERAGESELRQHYSRLLFNDTGLGGLVNGYC